MEHNPDILGLQLEDYVFPKVLVQSAKARPTKETELFQEVRLALQRHQSDSNRFLLTMEHEFRGETGELLEGYSGEIHARGKFRVTSECLTDLGSNKVYIEAAKLLIAPIREMVAMLTSRGEWSKLMLPYLDIEKLFKEQGLDLPPLGQGTGAEQGRLGASS